MAAIANVRGQQVKVARGAKSFGRGLKVSLRKAILRLSPLQCPAIGVQPPARRRGYRR